ncbi:transketolase family protein [Arenibacter sp. ARW7G5Y1]|uniref:transketolase family protein n=2 Tax=unclassified Arenibacter TaxID=2615047 RepID=UPI000D7596FD|nr:transketolase C-terminal domain-containing protein [Arenibacter sp. ARW7G5Y1]PXX27381.1 transketolase [Arenibacter sp. ARW7G5Y1]|tara:strand:- start:23170 stop:24147 length:978 start_codon:yes stop_codon:yes gene_type:complete
MELDKIQDKNLLMGEPNQVVFSEILQELAAADSSIIAVTSDSRGSGKLVPFGDKYPKQIVEVGIAEQNLVGVAAGLASAGKKAFAVSPACFLSARALEQIKNDVAYSDNPVTLVGISAGVSYGALGTTHHSLHDYAALRAINNIIIVAPADNFETEQAVRLAAQSNKPIYMRLGKKAMPFLNVADTSFEFGKGRVVRKGRVLTFIASGETVYPAWLAAKKLEEDKGIRSTVISMHTIKPLDTQLLESIAAGGQPIITVEEHMVNGGLGEACAAHLFQKGYKNPFRIVGIPDEYTVTGSQMEIFQHYGISEEGLYNLGLEMLTKNS